MRSGGYLFAYVFLIPMLTIRITNSSDTNGIYDPCSDAKVQKSDGFTFGLAFSSKDSFFFNQTLLSPCDSRLNLAVSEAQLAIFRPKVDEISLLTLNTSNSSPRTHPGFVVAFAGRKYAARSLPAFLSDDTNTITSLTLVLEFQKGTLQNLYWKRFGCGSCAKDTVCVGGQECGVPSSKCKSNGGSLECNLGIQLAFSGTDKNDKVLNSWYEVNNLRQYSLSALYSDIHRSIAGMF